METLTQEEQDLLDKAIEENDYKHIIPVNSKTLTMNFAQSRFTAAEWYEKAKEQAVILAGCGGIGSYTGFLLARLGIRSIVLYDNDVVGEENLSGQLFGINEIGKNKAVALAAFIVEYADMTNTTVTSLSTAYHSESSVADIMICGFDNMAARNLFFHKWKEDAINQLGWSKELCFAIAGNGGTLINKKGEIAAQIITGPESNFGYGNNLKKQDCNCNAGYVSDFCIADGPCDKADCNASNNGCGWIFVMKCNGRCSRFEP